MNGCEINGIYAYHYASNPVATCGPDGKCAWISEDAHVAFGHRRLAELSEAGKPVVSVDGAQVVTFGGEISNRRELRLQLETEGRSFRTGSDAEVLLHLYAQREERMLEDLRGTFVFAIWESRHRRLLLARDPSGTKPLYYADDGWTFRFASEPFHQDVRAVPAGTILWVDSVGQHEPKCYLSIAETCRRVERTHPKPVRCLALVTDAFGGFGGIAQYNRDFLSALASASSVKEIVVLPRLAEPLSSALPPRIRQLEPCFGRAAYALAAWRALRSSAPFDVIFCGHLFMAPLATMLARLSGAKLWLQVHGVDAWPKPRGWIRWGAQEADLVTSVSRYTRTEMIRNWWRSDPMRIRVLSNTVSEEFRPGPKPERLIARYGVAGRKLIITVSRLSAAERYKGHDRVIKVTSRIREQHPEALYLIFGDGDDLPRLRALAVDAGQQDHVVFAGRIPANELADHYRLADVFVMPSTGEGFGIVYLEAAASGVPVIGGRTDGSWDALREGALGDAVDPENFDELAHAICAALSRSRPVDASAVDAFRFDRYRAHVERLLGELGNVTR
jgi:phosphatidyl-myo-inositol dimannoside synthase